MVLIQDPNQVRGNWRLGIVSQADPGSDSRVRKVEMKYKNPRPGELVDKFQGRGYVTVQRSVNRLIVLVPADGGDKKTD